MAALIMRRELPVTRRWSLVGLAFICGLCLMLSQSAQASKVIYDQIPPPGGTSAGSLGEQFSGIGGVAVNATGAGAGVSVGDIYVADSANSRIQQFRAKADDNGHRFVRAFGLNVGGPGVNVCTVASSCQAGTASGAAGGLSTPILSGTPAPLGVAVDQATGNLYVADIGNRRIDVFSSEGTFEGAFGWKVNATTPLEELQFCTTATGCQVGSAGSGAGQFGQSGNAPAIGYPAVAPNGAPNAGNVVVADAINNRIDEFSASLNGSDEVIGASFVRGIGWKVNAATPSEALQTCTTATGCQAGSTGEHLGQFTAGGIIRVAVDDTGAIYALNRPNTARCNPPSINICHVQKINAAATSAVEFAEPELKFTTGNARFVSAREIAVDPSTGDVYVARSEPSANEFDVLRFDSSGALQETYPTGIGVNGGADTVFGLAFDSTSIDKRLYLSSKTLTGPPLTGPHVVILADPPTEAAGAITLGTGPGANFAQRRLEGTVNPNEFKILNCRFEYGRTTEYGSSTACVPGTLALGEGAADKTVTAETEPLTPETTYHYRLIVENGGPVGRGDDESFTTGSLPTDSCANADRRAEQEIRVFLLPDCMALELVSPQRKDSQQARLPNVSANGDRVSFVSIGALGDSPSNTSLSGSRYVATRSGSGWSTQSTAPPVAIAKQWESVKSPSFTPDFSGWFTVGATAAQYQIGIEQVLHGSLGAPFIAQSQVLVPMAGGDQHVIDLAKFVGASADHSHFYFLPGQRVDGQRVSYHPGDPSGVTDQKRLEDENTYLARVGPDGDPQVVELLARDREGKVWGGQCGARLGGIGPTNGTQSAEPGGSGNSVRNQGAVSTDGARTYLSARAGQPSTGACDSANKFRILERIETDKGPRIGELFSSECSRPAAPSPPGPCSTEDGDDLYQGASVDGTKVYFTTNRQLTDSDIDGSTTECKPVTAVSGCDLYLYDSELPAGNRLIQVSAGESNADHEAGKDAKVYNNIAAISGDGSHVYFVAQGVLTAEPNTALPAGHQVAIKEQPNFYLWDRDTETTTFIGTLDPGDQFAGGENPGLWGGEGTFRDQAYPVPATGPDGRGGSGDILVFESKAELTADDTDGNRRDVFRFDAGAFPPTMECESCAPGAPDGAQFDVDSQGIGAGGLNAAPGTDFAEVGRWVSEDGRTISFATAEGLIPGDVNEAKDNYLWRDGQLVRLPGRFYRASNANNDGPFMSHDGSEVAFQTPSRLLPSDLDRAPDIYVARVGGGFPNPPPIEPCQPDASLPGKHCQESQQPPPAAPVPGSAARSGPGNPPRMPACRKGKVRRHGHCVSKRQKGRHRKRGHRRKHARHTDIERGAGK